MRRDRTAKAGMGEKVDGCCSGGVSYAIQCGAVVDLPSREHSVSSFLF